MMRHSVVPRNAVSSLMGWSVGALMVGLSGTVWAFDAPQVSAEIETELAAGLTQSGLQKADTIIKLEINGDLNSAVHYTLIPKWVVTPESDLYIDDPNERNYSSINGPITSNRHGLLELSEAYLDFEAWNGYWRTGKQQVVWGQADGLKVLDVVNPQDYREFNLDEFEDSRIPLWMFNAEFSVTDDSTLQVLVIPDPTYSKLADEGTPYAVTSPKYRPALGASPLPVHIEPAQRPDQEVEFGLRYRMFVQGWDLTLNYLHHRLDIPVIYRYVEDAQVVVVPVYEPSDLLGATASNAFGDWVVRVEAGLSTDSYHLRQQLTDAGIVNTEEFSSVVGLDYQGFTDWFLSYQWYQSTLNDYEADIERNRTRMQHTFLLRRSFFNETLSAEAFVLYSDEDQDGQFRAEISYQLNDAVRIWSGLDLFYGDQEGQFGQFDQTDRWLMGIKIGF